METFNVYGKMLMMIEDIEGPNGVKKVVQPGHEEYARDIGRVLTVLQEIFSPSESQVCAL